MTCCTEKCHKPGDLLLFTLVLWSDFPELRAGLASLSQYDICEEVLATLSPEQSDLSAVYKDLAMTGKTQLTMWVSGLTDSLSFLKSFVTELS